MDRDCRSLVVKELSRILKPGGKLHVAEFVQDDEGAERYLADEVVTGEYGTVVVRNEEGNEIYRTHHFTKDELHNLLINAGFKIVFYDRRDFPTFKKKFKRGHIFICESSESF